MNARKTIKVAKQIKERQISSTDCPFYVHDGTGNTFRKIITGLSKLKAKFGNKIKVSARKGFQKSFM